MLIFTVVVLQLKTLRGCRSDNLCVRKEQDWVSGVAGERTSGVR